LQFSTRSSRTLTLAYQRETVAKALVYKALALDRLDRGEEANATYDEVVAQFKDAPEPKLRELVAKARYNRGSSTTLDLSTRSANQP
jgi:hypothetical protein